MDDDRRETILPGTPDDCCRTKSKAGLALVVLCLLYHGELSMGQVVEGCDSHYQYEVCWEYDLEHATGRVSIQSRAYGPVCNESDLTKITGLLSAGVHITATNYFIFGWKGMETDACSGMTELIPGEPIGVEVAEYDTAAIDFAFPPSFRVLKRPVQIEHFCSSPLPNCTLGVHSIHKLENFVCVAPIGCLNPDSELDGDVDLADFAEFLNGFENLSEGIRLPCFGKFMQAYTGPTASGS